MLAIATKIVIGVAIVFWAIIILVWLIMVISSKINKANRSIATTKDTIVQNHSINRDAEKVTQASAEASEGNKNSFI